MPFRVGATSATCKTRPPGVVYVIGYTKWPLVSKTRTL